jgi:ATP-dependent Clp protease ATP-binding subunit ClpC
VFQRFTDRARRVVVLAQDEARRLDHDYIGTEHLLLGLIREEDGVAAKALGAVRISLPEVRQYVEASIGRGERPPVGYIPFTPRAKTVLELALREALQLGHKYIGTEHILLGLVREGEGVAAQVLEKRGATMDRVRQTVIQLLSGYTGEPLGTGVEQESELTSHVAGTGASAEDFPICPTCRSPLAETLTAKPLEITVEEQPASVKIAYCGRCGTALGTIL